MKSLFKFIQKLTLLPTILAFAFLGGLFVTDYILKNMDDFEAFTIKSWKTYPLKGSPEADPYSKSRATIEGLLPLGRAEGIRFIADHDDKGHKLTSACSYRLKGTIPEASFFTLYAAAAKNKQPYSKRRQAPDILLSFDLTKNNAENQFTIFLGAKPQPGNWLALPRERQKFLLILTLYNTPILTNGQLKKYDMLNIEPLKETGSPCA